MPDKASVRSSHICPLDRILLLLTALLAAYQVDIGINGLGTIPILAYTIAFGVLVVAGLLIIIPGFEALDSPIVVIVSAALLPQSRQANPCKSYDSKSTPTAGDDRSIRRRFQIQIIM